VAAFIEGLRENGLHKERDYVLDVLWAEGDYARFPKLASELLQRNPSIILVTTIAAARAAQRAAPTTTPIVMTSLTDPVGTGLIASLSRPGGNTTGVSTMAQDLTSKGFELVRDIIPRAMTFAVLFNSANPINRRIVNDLPKEAEAIGATIQPVGFATPEELEPAFGALKQRRPDALIVVADGMIIDQRERIATLALQHRLPTVSPIPELTDVGGLIGYGSSRIDMYRRAAYYVKRILDGVKPADLPVEQPIRIELSINLKTAQVLGISIPVSILARADRVIE
jgi:putative tryptophan/tyrosine transport system substrate-binding protein